MRTRLLWTYLQNEKLLASGTRILHVAAEAAIWRRLHGRQDLAYVTGDIQPGTRTSHVFDLTDAPFPDETFDVILVAHVLEHIPDDRAAMREIHRLLAPTGRALLQHPVDTQRAEIYEDWTVVLPAAREREFGQWDHVRAYAHAGLCQRLEEASLSVDVVDYAAQLPSSEVAHCGLRNAADGPVRYDNDLLYVCRAGH